MLDGIKSFMEFNIYGTIRNMQVIQLSVNYNTLNNVDIHQCYTILTYSSKTQSIVTEFSGMLDITSARETDQPIVVTVDTSSETLFVSAFTGYLIAIPYGKPDSSIKMTTKNRDSKALRFMPVPIRTNEFDFLSVAALQQASYASVLVGELEDLKTIKTFKYCEGPKELVEKKNMAMKVEATTHTLVTVPAPLGGMLAIGEYVITYYDPFSNTVRELSIEPVLVTAWEYLSDGSNRFLLGDSEGYLYMFILETGHNKVVNLSSTLIGQVVRPNCIIDLGNYMFYIGSTHGDSCLIQLVNAATPSKYSIRVLANYSCLGPIVDFCLFDYNEQGKQTMACCSGVDNDASIRIVENGIGFIKQAVLDFPLVYNMWPLKLEEQSDSLLITTALETILLKPLRDADNQFMEYASYSGLCTNETTLASGLWNDHIVQITPSSARLMTKDEHGTLLAEWKPPRNKRISMAKLKESYCLVCDEDDTIVYLEIILNTFIERSTTQVRNTSCMSISTCKENGTDNNYVVIGTFGSGSNIRLLQLPELQMIYEHVNAPITASPKDVLIVFMEGLLYLMVMLGDGQILSYCIKHLGSEHIMLYDERQMMVSTYCTGMYPYQYQGEQRIFVAGQKPSVISSFNQTLFVYSVNLTNIYTLTAYNDILALMTDHQLLFGKTDVVSKLQHTKYDIPGEMPLRVEYLSRTKALAVGSSTYVRDTNKNVMERTGKVRILDAQTFQVLDTYELGNNEIVESMCVARFKEYPDKEYLFIGTLIENQLDPNNNSGRILAFTIDGFK
ncbi:DNA damage-binding protein 1a, partial [Rhizopus azygosporus]